MIGEYNATPVTFADGARPRIQTDEHGAILTRLASASGGADAGIQGKMAVFDIALSLDINAYADGDVMADLQEVANFFLAANGAAIIQNITVLDKDDQGIAFDIMGSPNAESLGTENAAPDITDTEAEGLVRLVRISAGDYIDLGGAKLATLTNLALVVGGATTSYYIGTIARGAGTFSAAGVRLRIGVLY